MWGLRRQNMDYAWVTLWESVEANNAIWSKEGAHHTPEGILDVNAKLYHFAASYSLVGGFTVRSGGLMSKTRSFLENVVSRPILCQDWFS